ncbi:MAG: hypothetical protein IPF44_00040 [Betaproteobacteria bacterium]|nr:hypothetical protein [Betaproteobacteria bacterium]
MILFSEKVTAMVQNFLHHFHFWSFVPVDRSIRAVAAQFDETVIFAREWASNLASLKIRPHLTQNRHPFFVIMGN